MYDDTLMDQNYGTSKKWCDDTFNTGSCDGEEVSLNRWLTTSITAISVKKHRYGKGF